LPAAAGIAALKCRRSPDELGERGIVEEHVVEHLAVPVKD